MAAALASVAVAEPLNRMVDLAGPDAIPLDDVVRQFLKANRDPSTVITDEQATYFGIPLKQRSLVPEKPASRRHAFRSLALQVDAEARSERRSFYLPMPSCTGSPPFEEFLVLPSVHVPHRFWRIKSAIEECDNVVEIATP